MTEPAQIENSPSSAAEIRPQGRVSWTQLVAYGSGGIIPIALFYIAGQITALLGNISLGLSAFWLGAILMVPRLWDAISDPLMGHITDNTRSRWGRRKPYILIGGIAVALSFVAIWWVPRGESVQAYFGSESAYNWFQLTFLLGGVLVFFTACTVFEIPHGALGMEMTDDYHERTRLFSAKSFLGNLFAMGTPWLIALASMEFFCGPGGDPIDGMRYVSIAIAAILIPLSFWWFATLTEPGFRVARDQEKTELWKDLKSTSSNKNFLRLVAIIFTLALGFNLVGNFANYIKIFYLYGGDISLASTLLGIDGTVWAVTALVAVFPLNWISERIGKNRTLIVAILLMCLAQFLKVFCYNPDLPYLVLLPTMLLSAGMLMFFTLGASMVADICDEDELNTGTRSEGSYYSVFWWFIKMGSALASLLTGALLLFTNFDEKQNVAVDELRGSMQTIESVFKEEEESEPEKKRQETLVEQMKEALKALDKIEKHFQQRQTVQQGDNQHLENIRAELKELRPLVLEFDARKDEFLASSEDLLKTIELILAKTVAVKQQSPTTLLRLRVVEICLPLILSVFSIWLTLKYPLTEKRCYEIKAILEHRRGDPS
ncbi:MAG: MFS transporter [Lacipirellulaceae bacterium]